MTTRWSKPVSRILPCRDRRTQRLWCITIDGPVVRLWLKGCRRARAYVVPVETIAMMGARIRAQELREAKIQARKRRKEMAR